MSFHRALSVVTILTAFCALVGSAQAAGKNDGLGKYIERINKQIGELKEQAGKIEAQMAEGQKKLEEAQSSVEPLKRKSDEATQAAQDARQNITDARNRMLAAQRRVAQVKASLKEDGGGSIEYKKIMAEQDRAAKRVTEAEKILIAQLKVEPRYSAALRDLQNAQTLMAQKRRSDAPADQISAASSAVLKAEKQLRDLEKARFNSNKDYLALKKRLDEATAKADAARKEFEGSLKGNTAIVEAEKEIADAKAAYAAAQKEAPQLAAAATKAKSAYTRASGGDRRIKRGLAVLKFQKAKIDAEITKLEEKKTKVSKGKKR